MLTTIDAPRAAAEAMSAVLAEDSERVRARIYGALKLTPRSVAWVTVKLGTPKGDGALQTLKEKDFWPVRTEPPPRGDAASSGWRDEIVPPMYSGEELAALRSRERDLFGR